MQKFHDINNQCHLRTLRSDGQSAPNLSYPQDIHRVTGNCNEKFSNEDESVEQNAPLTLGNTELYEDDEIEIDYVQKAGYKKVTGARFVKNNAKIASYNGETITTEYKSTTGQLTTGATVVYKLATPVTTEITDSTLLAQLETIINLKTYKKITNIESTGADLAPVIEFDYYKSISSLEDRIEILEAQMALLES